MRYQTQQIVETEEMNRIHSLMINWYYISKYYADFKIQNIIDI